MRSRKPLRGKLFCGDIVGGDFIHRDPCHIPDRSNAACAAHERLLFPSIQVSPFGLLPLPGNSKIVRHYQSPLKRISESSERYERYAVDGIIPTASLISKNHPLSI